MISTEPQKVYSMPLRGCVNIQLNGNMQTNCVSSSDETPPNGSFRDNITPAPPRHRPPSRSFVDSSCPIFKECSPPNTPRKRSTTLDIKTVKSLSEDKRRQIGSILRKDFDFRDSSATPSCSTIIHLDEMDEGVSLPLGTPPTSRQLGTTPHPPPAFTQKPYSPDAINPVSLNDVRQCTTAAFKRQYTSKDNDSAMGTSVNGDGSVFTDFDYNLESMSFNEETVRYVRVAFYRHKDMSVLLKVSCTKRLENIKLYDLMISLCEACKDLFKKKKTNVVSLAAHELNKLKFVDRRPAKEHVSSLSRELSDDLILHEAACQRSTKTFHVGTLVKKSLIKTQKYEIAESIILVTLTSLNRIAPVQEFIDQLCHHIEIARPSELGNPGQVALGRRPERLERAAKYTLLSQSFTHDSIISVAEAAHRSFLRIETFKHYL